MTDELRARTRQQAAVAALGNEALAGTDEAVLLADATRRVTDTLRVEFSAVLELLPGGAALLLRAGMGWPPGLIGRATLGAGRESHAGYAIETNQPVVISDLPSETRFRPPQLLREHSVLSGLSVLILGDGTPYGVLGAYTRARRRFTDEHVQFLQAVANVIALARRRRREERAREERALLLGQLTRRELQVLRLLAAGLSNRQIGQRIGIRYSTVRGYVRAVIEKLGAHSELEAVARAHELGLADNGR
ncbi:MAG TPA: GAF domain-containing protein [Candidatus Limnocylindria bacterium]|nr:GAF domain-containing protein [Candidatus Limnocylindria bacterium]